MQWAFVDYENVNSLEMLDFHDYERVFVFCGRQDRKIKVGALPSDGFCGLELIGVPKTGRNNLDFHLAFHLGRFHEIADTSIAFHIISNDKGFDGLTNHLKKLGRRCKKIADLSNEASRSLSRLKKLDRSKRPRTRERLLNWIKGQVLGGTDDKSPEAICSELVKANLISDSGPHIVYDIES